MKTCPNCNKQINDNDNLCMYCGHSYVNKNEVQEEKIHTTHTNSEKKNNKKNKFIIPFAAIILVVVSVFIITSNVGNKGHFEGFSIGMTYTEAEAIIQDGYGANYDANSARLQYNDKNLFDIDCVDALITLDFDRNNAINEISGLLVNTSTLSDKEFEDKLLKAVKKEFGKPDVEEVATYAGIGRILNYNWEKSDIKIHLGGTPESMVVLTITPNE